MDIASKVKTLIEEAVKENGYIIDEVLYVKEEGKVVWANSQKKVYTTKSAYTRPSKTTYISVNSRGTNSIKISWNSVKGATGYRVYVKKKGEKSFKALSTQTGRT